jgi:ferredoxin
MNERRAQRRGNGRLKSSPDSSIFRQKELELMNKMAAPLACSPCDKCAARYPTCLLLLKPGPHKDSSGYKASWIFKRRQRRKGVATLLHKNSSSYEREREERYSHTTRVYCLSELVAPWPMNEFLH